VTCYNCGSTNSAPYAEENGYSLVKCSGCGLLFVDNPPNPVDIADAARNGRHHGDRDLQVTGRFHASKVPRYAVILRDLFGGDLRSLRSWLDVGCGHGELMMAILELSEGSTCVRGMEPNVRKVTSARSRNLDVSAFDLTSHEAKYDVVSMLDVYSHLPNPPKFISLLTRLLKPQGELLIQTGDAAGFAAEEQLLPFGLPDHLSFASEKIVVDILKRQGFEILCVRKYSYLNRDWISVAKEVLKLFLPNYRSRLRCYFNWDRYARTNMFIRARLVR
jgi:SAM-dependent methyltransferase